MAVAAAAAATLVSSSRRLNAADNDASFNVAVANTDYATTRHSHSHSPQPSDDDYYGDDYYGDDYYGDDYDVAAAAVAQRDASASRAKNGELPPLQQLAASNVRLKLHKHQFKSAQSIGNWRRRRRRQCRSINGCARKQAAAVSGKQPLKASLLSSSLASNESCWTSKGAAVTSEQQICCNGNSSSSSCANTAKLNGVEPRQTSTLLLPPITKGFFNQIASTRDEQLTAAAAAAADLLPTSNTDHESNDDKRTVRHEHSFNDDADEQQTSCSDKELCVVSRAVTRVEEKVKKLPLKVECDAKDGANLRACVEYNSSPQQQQQQQTTQRQLTSDNNSLQQVASSSLAPVCGCNDNAVAAAANADKTIQDARTQVTNRVAQQKKEKVNISAKFNELQQHAPHYRSTPRQRHLPTRSLKCNKNSRAELKRANTDDATSLAASKAASNSSQSFSSSSAGAAAVVAARICQDNFEPFSFDSTSTTSSTTSSSSFCKACASIQQQANDDDASSHYYCCSAASRQLKSVAQGISSAKSSLEESQESSPRKLLANNQSKLLLETASNYYREAIKEVTKFKFKPINNKQQRQQRTLVSLVSVASCRKSNTYKGNHNHHPKCVKNLLHAQQAQLTTSSSIEDLCSDLGNCFKSKQQASKTTHSGGARRVFAKFKQLTSFQTEALSMLRGKQVITPGAKMPLKSATFAATTSVEKKQQVNRSEDHQTKDLSIVAGSNVGSLSLDTNRAHSKMALVDEQSRRQTVGALAHLKEPEMLKNRGHWDKNIEFLLAVVGFAVDLGNVWRFPYVCYQNGGGVFLVIYTLLFVFGGLPIFYLEMLAGQYFSSGCLTVWQRVCPLAKGIGYAMCFLNFYTGLFYNTIISWAAYFFVQSLTTGDLPWTTCSNSWNIQETCRTMNYRKNNHNNSSEQTNFTNPATEFFERKVLMIQDSGGIEDIGSIRWPLASYLAVVFMLVYFAIWKGVKSTGKAVWVTALLPYFVLIPLLIRGFYLDGSGIGIHYYLMPNFEKIFEVTVWVEAAKQIFFSLGPGFGTLLALSSYNKFDHNCRRDTLIAAAVNYFASFIAGFVIFSVLGYMAKMQNVHISQVVREGPGLVFEVYPEGLATMQFAPLWSALFFIMVITLGIDSTFGGLESVITGLCDEYPRKLRAHRGIFIAILLTFIYLCSIPTTTKIIVSKGGNYVINLIETYGSTLSLLFIVLVESMTICWIYGVDKFSLNVSEMSGGQLPGLYWRFCWKYVSPTILLFLFIAALFLEADKYKMLKFNDYIYPTWSLTLGWLMTISSVSCVPIYAAYKLFTTPGTFRERLKISITPVESVITRETHTQQQISSIMMVEREGNNSA